MKFLFATDGSEGADGARDVLLSLPHREHDQVVILGVPVYGGIYLADTGSAFAFDALAWERDYVEDLVARTRRHFASRGIMGGTIVREGPVAETIIAAAHEVAADLIVIGSRGLGRVAGTLLGSVARAVARHSPIPVLVVRDRRIAPRRILAAVDGSDDSNAALDLLANLPLPKDAELTLLHVCEAPRLRPAGAESAAVEEYRTRIEGATRERATRVLAHASSRLPATRVTNAYCEEGHAVEQILAKARATGSDLVVLGARGMTLGGRFLQGSVADRVLNEAPCCVLVAKKPAAVVRIEAPGRAEAVGAR